MSAIEHLNPQTGELVPVGGALLALQRAPEVALTEAAEAARGLQQVISAQPNPVKFNGKVHLRFEDWQLLGAFYGVAARVEWTRPLAVDGVHGFESRAVAVVVATGQVISAGEASCCDDEDRWRSRPRYEWRTATGGKRERVQVGEDVVPSFQLRSMSQTRACAKALRNCLAWVVVLAGYGGTPAEELPAQEAVISGPMQKRLFAVATEHGWATDALKAHLADAFGVTSTAAIPRRDYDAIVDSIRQGPPAARDDATDAAPF